MPRPVPGPEGTSPSAGTTQNGDESDCGQAACSGIGSRAAAADWTLMPFPHLQELPALKWKMLTLAEIRRRNSSKFRAQADELAARLDNVHG